MCIEYTWFQKEIQNATPLLLEASCVWQQDKHTKKLALGCIHSKMLQGFVCQYKVLYVVSIDLSSISEVQSGRYITYVSLLLICKYMLAEHGKAEENQTGS